MAKIRAAICCGHCWGHQEGQASAAASCVPQHSTLSRPRAMTCPSLVGPLLSPALPLLPLGHPRACSLVWGQQGHADCPPTGTGAPAASDLRQWLWRRTAAETHAASRARDMGGPSCPQTTSVFSRAAFPKEPVGSRSFPPSPCAKENRLCRCLFVCRGCSPSV